MFVLIIILIAAAIFVWWRLTRRKRALTILMTHSQNVTDRVVAAALQNLDMTPATKSTAVADVWGHGVMAFSYQVQHEPVISREELNLALARVADQETIASSDISYPAFLVTDLWQRDGRLNFDVAFMTNQATIDYVEDLNRLTD